MKAFIQRVAEAITSQPTPVHAAFWPVLFILIASSYAYSQAIEPETHILARGVPFAMDAGSRVIAVTWKDDDTLALDPPWADFADPVIYLRMKLPPRVRSSVSGNLLHGDFQKIDGTWQRYFSLPWDDGAFSPAPAPSTRSRTKAATSPAPMLINGDFSTIGAENWRNMPNNKDYLGRAFKYQITTAAGWSAYKGTAIEVWTGGDGQGSFIELDATKSSSGIKQPIKNAVAGGYALFWKELGRNNPESTTNNYHVKIYYVSNGTEVPIAKLIPSRNAATTAWKQAAFSFSITKDQFDAAAKAGASIHVAFIPDDNNTFGCLVDDVKLMPIALKVTDFATRSDALPYVATSNATPPKNTELCLRADKTSEKAKVEIALPSISDVVALRQVKWKVVKKPTNTVVSEGVFGGTSLPNSELSLFSGRSVEDEILFEVQVGADSSSFIPTARINVRVVRDRLIWFTDPFSGDFGWRTAKPEARVDTGDYKRKQIRNAAGRLEWIPDTMHPDHHASAYKRESLQSVYEFYKSSTNIGPSTPKTNWVKPAITCFGQFHEALKSSNGNNPLVDLNSLARINMSAVSELASFDLKYGALRSRQGRQTTFPADSNPTLRASQFPERVTWATAAAKAIGKPNLTRGRLLAIWQKEGSLRLNTQNSTTTSFDANFAATELGGLDPTSSDEAKVCYIYNATYQCLGSDFLIRTYRINGVGDNVPDLRDYAAAKAHIRKKADQFGGAGSGDKLFKSLTATAAPSGYTISVNAPAFYQELLRLVGLFYLAGWQPEGADVSYMVYNMGNGRFANLRKSLTNAAYPERIRLGLSNWAVHYEIRADEFTGSRDHAQKFHAYRVAFEAKYP